MKNKNIYGDFEFIFKEPQNFEGCTLLNGWHGIGECGFISMSHLVDKLGAERIGYIITSNIPQFITIKNNKITFPFEIYRSGDVVIILPIFEPIKSEHLIFTKTVVQWTIDQKFKQAILVGGLDRRLQDETEIKAIYTKSFRDNRQDIDIQILDEGLYVTGPLAYMLMFFELNDFEAIALLPYAERSRPDPVAASMAIQAINKILDTNVNVQELLDEAEKIEKEIESLLKANKSRKDLDKESDEGMFV
ncbi:proteasome assembly chaperone family protein [Candidatus Heimdallarchaeota archaeon]|nr:MAG: proteasome assembly chaperone family protein [Candidatus Heimdallarchaeota archaeon]